MRYAQCPMPNAQCPMPNARRVPHVTEKGYIFLCHKFAMKSTTQL
ncbi:hypothetical protein [Microcoleus sp.]